MYQSKNAAVRLAFATLLIASFLVACGNAGAPVTCTSTLCQNGGTCVQSTSPNPCTERCRFELQGFMTRTVDPFNPNNFVVGTVNPITAMSGGNIVRKFPPGVKATTIRNQINVKYLHISPRTCVEGSPRISLDLDRTSDGTRDNVIFGYVGHVAYGAGCIQGTWDILDMTDAIGRWDASQAGGGQAMTYAELCTYLDATYPAHQLLAARLTLDPIVSTNPAAQGSAFYDVLTLGDCTLDNGDNLTPGGQPLTTDTGATCSCASSYSGQTCETGPGCVPNPCQGTGSTCTALATGYRCNCAGGRTGTNCEFAGSCSPNPCPIGQRCTQMAGNSYSCAP
jgi:hypothetical protein